MTGNAVGQAKDDESLQWEDFAEIYVDRYLKPDPSLELDEDGEEQSRAHAYFAMGLSLEQRKQIDRAIAAYRKVLELKPNYYDLSRKVGFMLAKNGQPEEGRAVLEETLKRNRMSPQSYLVLSEYLATYLNDEEEDKKRALKLAEEAVEKFPGYPPVYEHLVKMHLIARQPGKAQAVMDQALSREEPNPFYWLRLAETAKRVWPISRNEGAEPVRINGIYEKALKLAPEDPRIQERVANHYRDSRQHEMARKLYEELIEEHPDRLDIRRSLADVLGGLGKENERIETLKAIVQINPQDAETHKELGRIYQARNDQENAIEHFRQALRIVQGSVSDIYDLGILMLEAGKTEDAARLFERGAYLYPAEPIMPIMRTHAYSALDQWDKAVEQFEFAVELASESRPDMLNERFYFRYGAAVERDGDIDRAANLFRKSMDLLAKNDTGEERDREFRAELYNYMGYMWVENDMKIDEAGELIKQAIELKPDSGAITDSLGWFYFKKEKYAEAKRQLLKAEKMVEEPDAVIHDHLGQVFFKLGEMSDAVGQMEKAVELDPENEEFRVRLEEYRKKTPSDPKPEKPSEEDPEKPDPAKNAA